ncbi:MAG: penicillin acylase family protein, partial [Gemmatimonadales bacterium]
LDAYRALGYVTARDRLVQMELQVRALAGTLTGLVGEAALEADRNQRALGLAASADSTWAHLDPGSPELLALESYAEGVNAWIATLTPENYPIEYRLLGAAPFRWEPEYSLYILKRMGQTLTQRPDNIHRTERVRTLGRTLDRALFPVDAPIREPVIPSPGKYPALVTNPIPPPPESPGNRVVPAAPVEGQGSNAWAVSPFRTANRHALLAGDPHLELTLPAIWYEVHVMAPGLDVYGVTIPGTPFVAIGFNRDVAWTFTSAEADVQDTWREVVNDPVHPSGTRLDDGWRRVNRRIEEYRDAGGALLAVDTFYRSHRGEMSPRDDAWFSTRWTVTEPDSTLSAFIAFARAGDVSGWMQAGRKLGSPALTAVVADRSGTIAVRILGRLPVRSPLVALEVADGTSGSAGWDGYVPFDSMPAVTNPA